MDINAVMPLEKEDFYKEVNFLNIFTKILILYEKFR